eukprot:TRINITY_DN1210_c0_g1_i1.p1 TRINITY_DN1210_c0_g1~~TRINITY_DN1210_c0_g1_i1.p1  ORF type:complete len:169 (-),score=25.39 TRINITY_DN1210_c0_g1_i1:863-1369(-)
MPPIKLAFFGRIILQIRSGKREPGCRMASVANISTFRRSFCTVKRSLKGMSDHRLKQLADEHFRPFKPDRFGSEKINGKSVKMQILGRLNIDLLPSIHKTNDSLNFGNTQRPSYKKNTPGNLTKTLVLTARPAIPRQATQNMLIKIKNMPPNPRRKGEEHAKRKAMKG